MVPMWMYPLSIACGNSFILKPSEKNPSCGIKLAELFIEAGLPNGVFNVLNGDKDLVNMLLNMKTFHQLALLEVLLLLNIFTAKLQIMERECRHWEGQKTI